MCRKKKGLNYAIAPRRIPVEKIVQDKTPRESQQYVSETLEVETQQGQTERNGIL